MSGDENLLSSKPLGPPSDTIIRRAELRDFPELAGLYLNCRRLTFDWLPADSFHLEDFYRDTQSEVIWLARYRHKLLGFASIYLQSAFLHALYIAKEAQGCGIGTALLDHASRMTPGRLTLKCLTLNRAAQAFYHARGWTIIGSGESAQGRYLTFQAPNAYSSNKQP